MSPRALAAAAVLTATLAGPVAGQSPPGVARVGYGEHNQRRWLGLWADHLAASTEP